MAHEEGDDDEPNDEISDDEDDANDANDDDANKLAARRSRDSPEQLTCSSSWNASSASCAGDERVSRLSPLSRRRRRRRLWLRLRLRRRRRRRSR